MEDLDNNNSLEDKDDKNSEYLNSENFNQINYIKTHLFSKKYSQILIYKEIVDH